MAGGEWRATDGNCRDKESNGAIFRKEGNQSSKELEVRSWLEATAIGAFE